MHRTALRGPTAGIVRLFRPCAASGGNAPTPAILRGMAHDPELADRLREHLALEPDVTEKRMFGGLAFLVAGHLAVSASGQGGLLVRCDPRNQDALQQDPRVAPFVMRGRPMTGWVHVDVDGAVSDEDLDGWLDHGMGFARSLPPR